MGWGVFVDSFPLSRPLPPSSFLSSLPLSISKYGTCYVPDPLLGVKDMQEPCHAGVLGGSRFPFLCPLHHVLLLLPRTVVVCLPVARSRKQLLKARILPAFEPLDLPLPKQNFIELNPDM